MLWLFRLFILSHNLLHVDCKIHRNSVRLYVITVPSPFGLQEQLIQTIHCVYILWDFQCSYIIFQMNDGLLKLINGHQYVPIYVEFIFRGVCVMNFVSARLFYQY